MIVDTSALLLVAVAHETPYLDAANFRELLARIAETEGLAAPHLLSYELGNAIHRKRARELGQSLAQRKTVYRELHEIVRVEASSGEVLAQSAELAELWKASFYDASFLAHAKAAASSLLTGDRRMSDLATAHGIRAYFLPGDLPLLEADFPEPPAA